VNKNSFVGMKKRIFIFSMSLFVLFLGTTGCGGSDTKTVNAPAHKEPAQYQCPMKDTQEKFDKPGKCPICGTELEKITNS
jgi:hypothetical protein